LLKIRDGRLLRASNFGLVELAIVASLVVEPLEERRRGDRTLPATG
jgi:hypothetical protein